MSNTSKIDEILDMEQVGDVVNSQFEVHTLGDEPDIECIHIEKWAKERAKDQLYQLILEIIGDDELPHDIHLMDKNTAIFLNNKIAFCNGLKAEQRQKLNNLFGKEE